MLPFFFLTNSIGAPQGDTLGLINLFSNSFSNYFLSFINSDADILYVAMDIGLVLDIKSIANSTSYSGGTIQISLGKTSGNFHTTGRLEIKVSLSNFREASIMST